MNPKLEAELMKKIKRADRVIFWCIIGLLMLVMALFISIIYQNQINSDKARDLALYNVEIARQQSLDDHLRTQNLVVCVAEALTKPLADRGQLDECLIKAEAPVNE